jgi:hypothetical protein
MVKTNRILKNLKSSKTRKRTKSLLKKRTKSLLKKRRIKKGKSFSSILKRIRSRR